MERRKTERQCFLFTIDLTLIGPNLNKSSGQYLRIRREHFSRADVCRRPGRGEASFCFLLLLAETRRSHVNTSLSESSLIGRLKMIMSLLFSLSPSRHFKPIAEKRGEEMELTSSSVASATMLGDE